MYDNAAIEAINFEQLVTATDRLLVRGRASKRRLSTNRFVVRLVPPPPVVPERTVIVQRPRPRVFDTTSAAVIAALSTVALVLASSL